MKLLSSGMGLAILLASVAHGASGGMISGTVKDPNGAPFKGAFVQARSETKSKITISVLSDKQGHYRIENLSPGGYEVRVTAIGYKGDPRAGVEVAAEESATLDFALQEGMVRWSDLSVQQAMELLPEGKGKATFIKECNRCHGFQTRIAGTRRDEAGWRIVADRMKSYAYGRVGLSTDQGVADLVAYLNTVFGLDSKLPRSPAELPEYQKVKRGEFSDEAMKIVYVEYEMPGPNRWPFSAVPDKKDGNIWMPYMQNANGIGRLDPNTGEVQEFRLPHQGYSEVHSAVPAPDGTVWFTEQGPNKIGKWDPSTGKITEYKADIAPGKAGGEGKEDEGGKHTVRIDSKGYVWATGVPATRFDPKTEKFTYFWELSDTYGIVLDQEGNVWFTLNTEDKIGKVDAKTGKVTKYAVPTPKAFPRRIQVDSEGIVWFGEYDAGKIGRFDPKTEAFKEYQLPGALPTPYALGIDRNNQIWYSSSKMDVIGRLDPKTGQVTEYPVPYTDMNLREFFLDSQGRMWMGMSSHNKVCYFMLATGSESQ